MMELEQLEDAAIKYVREASVFGTACLPQSRSSNRSTRLGVPFLFPFLVFITTALQLPDHVGPKSAGQGVGLAKSPEPESAEYTTVFHPMG